MTQEEKSILLQDLCTRLPYGVKVQDELGRVNKLVIGNADLIRLFYNDFSIYGENALSLPLLRPMSSMTEEEKKEFESLGWRVDELDDNAPWNHNSYNVFDGVDWLNKKMFDYRGLIPMGLALEAKEGMYDKK